MKYALLAAAALAAGSLTPAAAQQVISNPGYCAQFYPNANCQNNGANSPYNGDYQRRGGTSGQNDGWYSLGWNNSYDTANPQGGKPQTRQKRRVAG